MCLSIDGSLSINKCRKQGQFTNASKDGRRMAATNVQHIRHFQLNSNDENCERGAGLILCKAKGPVSK